MDKKGSKISTIFFGFLFIIGGIAGIGYGAKTVLQASSMNNWPTVVANITSSRVRIQTPDSGGSSTYIAEISYQYEVAGRIYTSNRISSAQYGTNDSSRANKQVRKYQTGKKFTAYYDPDNTSYAVLDTQWDRIYSLAFAAGTCGLLLGFFMLRNAVRN